MRKIVNKTSFLGGEAGYLLEGRSDLAQFQLGCNKLENFIALKGGGVTRRPGTRYVKNALDNHPARLMEFVVSFDSGTDIYCVEASLDEGASPKELDFRIIRVSDNNVYTPTNSPIQVPDAFSSDSLSEMQYAQIGETFILVSKHFQPKVLRRTATTPTFSIDNFIALSGTGNSEWLTVPYRDTNVSSTTLASSAATVGTGRTITASTNFFTASHVGAYFRHTVSATTGYFKITAYTNATTVTAEVLVALGGTGASTDWSESAWSTERGWPRTITFYNQRTVFGGNTSQPDTFWASLSSDYFQMSETYGTTATPASPQVFTLASQRLNSIQWMVGGKKLSIGTTSSEWVGQFREDGTNLFVEFDEETNHGSGGYVQPRRSAYTVPFVQRSRQTLREMVFDFDSDSYVATDLNLFASHIGTPYDRFIASSNIKIVEMAFQEGPFNILWVIDSVGRLYGLTRDRQQQIAAWHSHVPAGSISELLISGLAGNDYPAWVESVCCIPSPNGTVDRLWMVVLREINGAAVRHIEYVDEIKPQPYVTAGSTADLRAHLDCATLSTGVSATTWTGFTRFASDTAYVIAEDANGRVVQAGAIAVNGSGEITLDTAATKVMVGLHVDAELRLLPLDGGQAPEINQRSIKRADTASIRMHQTFGLRVGKNRINRKTGYEENTSFEPIKFDISSAPPLPTFTGIKEVQVPTDTDTDGSFALVMQEPWGCTILSISSRVVTNEV